MIKNDVNDTIAAISTAPGDSGIGIVRLSGKDALRVADRIFVSKDARKASGFKTYTVHYGWIKGPSTLDRRESTDIIDEVILTVMRAPRSYTKEDIVEINCHGGIMALRGVLDLVLENGCRLAEPGEFTKRAFLNGRIDLAQAEAVLDVIRSKTEAALRIGISQLKGALSSQVQEMRNRLLEILSLLEANIDFPEEEITPADAAAISEGLRQIQNKLKEILDTASYGKVLRDGLNTVICGKPNVGKSSLLNALLKEERSIVTPVPGTTRDAIEEVINIKGIPVRIVDTAGIIEPKDLVEKKAIQRAKKYIQAADLVILLFDGSKNLSREDKILMRKLKNKPVIAVINKIDLKQKIEREKILKEFSRIVTISAKRLKNINLLEEAIYTIVYQGKLKGTETVLVSNVRHVTILKGAEKLIAEAIDSLDNKLSWEFICQDLKEALAGMDEVLGRCFSQDLLAKIFSDFCIGK